MPRDIIITVTDEQDLAGTFYTPPVTVEQVIKDRLTQLVIISEAVRLSAIVNDLDTIADPLLKRSLVDQFKAQVDAVKPPPKP